MAVRESGEPDYYSFEEGIDDTSIIGTKATRNTLSVASNVDLIDEFLCKTRGGYAPVNTTPWGTRNIRKMFDMTLSTGAKKLLVFGENVSPSGSSGAFGTLSGTTITTVATGLADGIKPAVVQFDTRTFVFNGRNDFVYDGTTKTQIGISAPLTAPAYFTNAVGSMVNALSYLGVYTYYNSTTGAESSPSPVSAAVIPTTGGIEWTVASGDSTKADRIRFYRTVGNGSLYFFDGDVPITSTSYSTTGADALLGEQLEEDNTRPPLCTLAIVNENRIMAVSPENPSRIIQSKIGQTGPMPESFQVEDFTDCNANDGNKIQILGVVNGITIVVKNTTVGKLVPINSFQSNELESGGYQKYVYQEIAPHITAIAGTGITVDNLFVWLGTEDVYATNGVDIIRFGARIRNTLAKLVMTNSYRYDVVNKVDTKQIIFTVIRTGRTEPDFQLVGHYRNPQKIAWTYYTPGTNLTDNPGIRASALAAVTVNSKIVYYFGTSNGDGTIYRMDYGTNDNTKGIAVDVRLPWESLGKPSHIKTFHSYYPLLLGNGNPYNVTHTFERNKQEIIVKTATSDLSAPNAPLWNNVDWNEFNWASLEFKPRKFFPHTKAYFGRYGFNNSNADQPIFCAGLTGIVQLSPIHR